MSRAILVTGATGKQGGALIQSLLAEKADFRILALTRNSSSPSAQRLAAKSPKIALVQGNLDDTEAVFAEAKKASPTIWGVFAVITVNMKDASVEETQGKKLVDSAVKHGVQHFVYTSSGRGGDQATDVPHFITKHNVELHLKAASLKNPTMAWTILRPVAFMDNFEGGFLGKVFPTAWKTTVKSRRLQLVATEDIGLIGAKVFLEPQQERYAGRVINIAGDELTFEEMAKVWKEARDEEAVPTTFGFLITLLFWMSAEMRLMFGFFEREGFGVDLDETRKVLPQVQSLKTWLIKNKNKSN